MNKQQITDQLQDYVNRVGSGNKAAKLLDVSSGTISQILNGNIDKIADEMWRKIEGQINQQTSKGWQAAPTKFYKTFTALLLDAKTHSNTFAITADAGSGKTFATRQFAAANSDVYHIICCDWWAPAGFFSEVLRVMGLSDRITCNDNAAMMNAIMKTLARKDSPLLIFDEADKLQDKVLRTFISLYNMLEDICGIVLCATANLERRISNGVRRGTMGYNELYSRMGRRFIQIPQNNKLDITAICQYNGITDPHNILAIVNDSEQDLRRVKRKIHALKMQANG